MIKNSKKLLLSGIVATALATTANAGVILDFEAGVGVWNVSPSGDMSYNGTNINLEDDLGLESATNTYLYADFNHFIPIVPNVRIEKQDLVIDGTNIVDDVVFGNKTYTETTITNLDLTQTDLIFYWGIPGLNLLTAGIVDINFGLDLKQFKGGITLDSTTVGSTTADLDFVVPMGYVSTTIDPPFVPATLVASYKTISYKDSSLKDMMAKVCINLPIPIPLIDIKAELGYKEQSLVIGKDLSDSLEADIKFSGMIFGISAKF
jgi:outer membrane protein